MSLHLPFVRGDITLGAAGDRGILTGAAVREALRVTSGAFSDDYLSRLKAAAFDRVERYVGILFGSRTYSERWSIERVSAVTPGDPWRPSPVNVTWAKWSEGNWATVSVPRMLTPEMFELAEGEWRASGNIGASMVQPWATEAVVRVMGYLFETDPAGMANGDVIRRSGAASLLGPHTRRMAT